MTQKLYARKGERVTCIDGHVIGIFKKNIYVGDAVTNENFDTEPSGLHFVHGEEMGNCPCGAPFNCAYDVGHGLGDLRLCSFALHVEGAWRMVGKDTFDLQFEE